MTLTCGLSGGPASSAGIEGEHNWHSLRHTATSRFYNLPRLVE